MINFGPYDDLFEPILVADSSDAVVYFNASFLTLFKLTPRHFKKNGSLTDFFKEHFPVFSLYLSELSNSEGLLSPELTHNESDQELTLIIKVKKIADEFHFYFKDMTVEKQLYEKYKLQILDLKSSHEQILQSDKLRVIGEMTANISHEINNPLTVVMGNSELIDFALESDNMHSLKADIQRYNKNIGLSVERINKIIASMKEYLHKNEELKEYFNINEVLNSSIDFLRPIFNKTGMEIEVVTDKTEPILYANKTKIEQVFVNLITNASDALLESGTISPKIKIAISCEAIEGSVIIDFIDNGPGISKEIQDKIFQSFFTTKGIGKGTGLGLNIVKNIVEAHQGRIILISSEKGAHFQIALPSVAVASYFSGDWHQIHNVDGNFKKILVVDNDANILNLCHSYLRDSDYYFLGATSAEEAIKQLARIEVDLVITDLKMPGMSGEDFVKKMRHLNLKTPVCYMSSKEMVLKYNKNRDVLGVQGVVIKPFSKDELLKALEANLYAKR